MTIDKAIARTTYGMTSAVLTMIEHGYTIEQVEKAMKTIQGMVEKEAVNSPEDKLALDFGLESAMRNGWEHFI